MEAELGIQVVGFKTQHEEPGFPIYPCKTPFGSVAVQHTLVIPMHVAPTPLPHTTGVEPLQVGVLLLLAAAAVKNDDNPPVFCKYNDVVEDD